MTIDPCWDVAGRLMDARDVRREGHVLLQENLASYLAQMPRDFVDDLGRERAEGLDFAVRRGFALGEARWTRKIMRDLEQPYDDAQVFHHATALNSELSHKAADTLRAAQGRWPCDLYLAGSLVKGRFGANSDLDALCEADGRVADAMTPFPSGEVHVQYLDQGDARRHDSYLSAFGPNVHLAAEQAAGGPHLLEGILSDALARRGLRVERDGDAVLVERAPDAPPHEKEQAPPSAGTVIWDWSDLPV